MSNALKQIQH